MRIGHEKSGVAEKVFKSEENMANDLVPIQSTGDLEIIQRKICVIRDVQVMLDRDLAELYQVELRAFNQAVRRNLNRFPVNFMFEVDKAEIRPLITNCDLSEKMRYWPQKSMVFTEQGIAMLSAVLRSEAAVATSIRIMNAFVVMRRFLLSNAQLFQRIETIEKRQLLTDVKVDALLTRFDAAETPPQTVFYDGQLWDACSLVEKLIARAKSSILLIDNWVGAGTLDMLAKKRMGVAVTLVTSEHKDLHGNPRHSLASTDIAKFNAQYPTLTIRYTESFHDRFLILDDKELYLIGASLKDLGKKCFAVAKLDPLEIAGLKARL